MKSLELTGSATESDVPSRAAITVNTANVKKARMPRRPSSKLSPFFEFWAFFCTLVLELLVAVENEGSRIFSDM